MELSDIETYKGVPAKHTLILLLSALSSLHTQTA